MGTSIPTHSSRPGAAGRSPSRRSVELGGTPADVVRTRTYITDRAVAGAAGQAHGEHFASIRPASTMVIVAGLLDERWVVEVELDAFVVASETSPALDDAATRLQFGDIVPSGASRRTSAGDVQLA